MPWPYFIWNGINSKSKNIVISEYPPIVKPKERMTQVTVPGRQGDLIIPEMNNEPMYEPYLKTITCYLLPGTNIQEIINWLSGTGTIVFGNEPDMIYTARIINQISFEKLLRGREHKKFSIPFYCQPLKEKSSSSELITLNVSGSQILNPGDVISHPQYTVYGSGTCSFTVSNRSDICQFLFGNDNSLVIDSENMFCTNSAGKNRCSQMLAEYPVLNPGLNTINWEGNITKIVIRGRWRWL